MLTDRIEKTISDHKLIEQGDRIIAACSGGADSVCLLMCLHRLKDKLGFDIEVVHVNHGIRGESAAADAQFTGQLAERLGLKFHLVCVDVPALVSQSGQSVEEAARSARYEALRQVAAGDKIAVAHNQGDQEETILFNIFRGSRLTGLTGMQFMQGDIIRPLLDVSREEIEEFLASENQPFCTDETNAEDDFSRNKIRHYLLPYIKENINAGAGEHLRSLAQAADEAQSLINEAAQAFEKEHVTGGEVMIDELLALNPAICSRVIYDMICDAAGRRKDIEKQHVEAVRALACAATGAGADLPYGIRAVRSYDRLVIKKVSDEGPDEALLESLNRALRADLEKGPLPAKNFPEKIAENVYTKYLDYDKIKGNPVWRTPMPGDYIHLDKAGAKPLRRYMIDAKIPRDKRPVIPVLADGDEIIWIAGYRINSRYKITETTKKVIAFNYK